MRKIKIGIIFILLGIILIFIDVKAKASEIKIITGHLPPYSCENDKGGGIFCEIFEEIYEFEKDKYTNKGKYYPWKRALRMTAEENKFVIFPLAYTENRKDKYLWAGPVITDNIVFIYKKIHREKYDNLQFKDFALVESRIIVLENAPPFSILKKYGFRNIHPTPGEDVNCNMMHKERYEVWFTAELIALNFMNEKGFNKDDYVFKCFGDKLDFYFALSTNLKNEAKNVQKEIDELKKDNIIKYIIRKYK